MKIKFSFNKIVDADSIDEAYDKVTKDIASSTEQRGEQYISKGEVEGIPGLYRPDDKGEDNDGHQRAYNRINNGAENVG